MTIDFESFYNTYFDRAMRTAYGIVRDENLAADAVQEAFIRVYRNQGSYDPDKSLAAWFNAILINECKRVMAKAHKVVYLESYQEHVLVDEGWCEKWDQKKEVQELLGTLDDKIKIPIILKYIQDLKVEEIAELMHVNPNTIKSRLLFGRNKLRQIYEKWYKEVK